MKKRVMTVVVLLLLLMTACGRKEEANGKGKTFPDDQKETEKAEEETKPIEKIPAAASDMILFVGGSRIWIPFEGQETTFSYDGEGELELSSEKDILTMTGRKEGVVEVTAVTKETSATVTVTVHKEYVETGSTDGTLKGWLEYFETELEGWSEADQVEYFLSLGDYMALVLPSSQYDEELINMGRAAAMIYPSTYLINNLSAMLMGALEYEEAICWLEKAVETGEKNAVVYTNLAQCFYEVGDYDAAFEWAGKAVKQEPGYGLAHLVMTCVHLQRGEDVLAIETLFKSMRSTYTETTSDLLRSLYRRVREAAGMTSQGNYDLIIDPSGTYLNKELGEMVLTEYHIELLFEAAAAGVITNGQDIPANQISLPYPVEPGEAVQDTAAWGTAAEEAWKETEAMLERVKGYTVGDAEMDERQAWCLAFLNLYYEYQIYSLYEPMYGSVEFDETGESFPENIEYSLSNLPWENDDSLHKIRMSHSKRIIDATEQAEEMYKNEWTIHTDAKKELYVCEKMISIADQDIIQYATRRKEMYEEWMRPLLEEYWLKMNAMLGYVENETVREMYGTRLLANINKEAYINPLYHAAPLMDTSQEYREYANHLRKKLEMEELELAKKRDARIAANKTKDGKLRDFDQGKENSFPPRDLVITIPPFSPVYVKFGMTGDNYMFAYGAFGTEIIKERNSYTGLFHETIITRSSVLPAGLGELSSVIGDIKDVVEAGSGMDFLLGKMNPVGAIPNFDRTVGEGRTYTYDYDGRLIDVSTIRETSTSGSLGGIGLGQTQTSSASRNNREGYLGTQWNTDTKTDLSFGPISVSY